MPAATYATIKTTDEDRWILRWTGVLVRLLLITALSLRFHIHLHHHFHGPPVDYLGLAAAAAASWIGVPGPGEPVLIAAGVFAAKHKLDIASVLVIAWAGATVGGIGGWLAGSKAGRAVVTARGPLRQTRLKAVARGEDVFARHPVIAVILTPSWVAGIHRVRAPLFLTINAAGAALWACGIGLGAYYLGPAIVEFVDDLGLITALGLGLLIVAGVAAELGRRRRRSRRAGAPAPDH